ncbi:MAG: rhomboid family intramembrane serine protease, partial [Bacteroidales bacterium]|nr:rhomboid family intramembrane serine protease [Bacteroidales bacterium]
DSVHVGASGLIYALNLFLIVSGFIRRNRLLIVISLIMVFLYGGFIWTMIPDLAKLQNISWEGHLSGAIVGVALAIIFRKKGPQKEEHHWEEEDEDNPDDPNNSDNTGEKPYWDVPTPSDEDLKVEYRFRR